jgi:hypothetical protein
MARCDRYIPYKVESCCPDLSLECNEVNPVININITRPTLNNLNNGEIIITLNGLVSRYLLIQNWNGFRTNIFGQYRIQNLPAGNYVFQLQSLTNPDCIWIYTVEVPPPIDFQTQLFYGDTFDVVPVLNNPNLISFITPEFQIRSNTDRLLNVPNDLNITFTIMALGQPGVNFTLPLNTSFDDFTTYGAVPNFLVVPGVPAQTPVIPANNQRPPLITGIQNLNNLVNDFVEVNLTPNNGNGWIRIRIWDSSLPTFFMHTYWVYIAETVLP